MIILTSTNNPHPMIQKDVELDCRREILPGMMTGADDAEGEGSVSLCDSSELDTSRGCRGFACSGVTWAADNEDEGGPVGGMEGVGEETAFTLMSSITAG